MPPPRGMDDDEDDDGPAAIPEELLALLRPGSSCLPEEGKHAVNKSFAGVAAVGQPTVWSARIDFILLLSRVGQRSKMCRNSSVSCFSRSSVTVLST